MEDKYHKVFMKDPQSKSIEGFYKALKIMKEHCEMDDRFFMGAEHDLIYFYCGKEPDSIDEEILMELSRLGVHWDSDGFQYHT